MSTLYTRILLGATIVVATLLRFLSPLGMTAIANRDYWYDEAFTGILLKEGWDSMNRMIFADVHPPLYYWLAKLWAAPFDYSPLGIRSFSAVIGLLSIVSIYWIARKLFNERAGILAAIITAFSPFAIEYSQEARMYALFGLLMLWAFYFFYQALQMNSRRDWLLWGLFAGLSFYTHYLSLFFFVMYYVAYVAYRWIFTSGELADKTLAKRAANAFIGVKEFWMGTGVIIVFFASWIKIFIAHISKGNLGWIDPAQISDIPKTLQIFFFGHPAGTGGVPTANPFRSLGEIAPFLGDMVTVKAPLFDGTSIGVVILAFMVTLFVIAWLKDIKRKEIMLLAILSFGTFLFLIFVSQINIKLYVARYFMPGALYVFLLFSGLVEEVMQQRWTWTAVLGAYVILLVLLKPLTFNAGWNEVYLNREILLSGDRLVLTGNPFDYSTARYYFGEDKVRYYNKGNPTEDFSGWVVVGNKNRITDPEEIRKGRNTYVILDGSCDWNGIELEPIATFQNLKACGIKE